jgi:hypothetical protein
MAYGTSEFCTPKLMSRRQISGRTMLGVQWDAGGHDHPDMRKIERLLQTEPKKLDTKEDRIRQS